MGKVKEAIDAFLPVAAQIKLSFFVIDLASGILSMDGSQIVSDDDMS